MSATAEHWDFRTRTTCRCCDSSDLEVVIDFGRMPLAGGFVLPERKDEDRAYPLILVRCRSCTLMQVRETVNPDLIFKNYSYSSSTTSTLISHFMALAQELVALAGEPGKLIVEFGCNDGVLIRPLRQLGATAVGVDPSDVALKASQRDGWPLLNSYFNEKTATILREQYGPAAIVTANNVFAHSDDIGALMLGVNRCLSDDGLFVFEVHYQGALLETVQFDTVYHEHLCYYSILSLDALLARFDFKILDVLRVPTHAGSIRVTAGRNSSVRVCSATTARLRRIELSWDVEQFVQKVAVRRDLIQRLAIDLRAAGKSVVAYGAAGRATVLLNYCGLGPNVIAYVVDVSPLRHGRLVPGVHVPIVPPVIFRKNPPDYAIMTAWNYEQEIVRGEKTYLSGGGRFIVPLPEPRLVGAC